jgi:hypothetical protein
MDIMRVYGEYEKTIRQVEAYFAALNGGVGT